MSTITVTNIKATGETASRAATGVAASYAQVDGDPVGLNGSFNVASATDVATGRFDIAFTNNMSAATYAVPAETDKQAMRIEDGYIAASGFRVTTELTSGTDADAVYAMFAVHGDLA
jgi:hypothetical protein